MLTANNLMFFLLEFGNVPTVWYFMFFEDTKGVNRIRKSKKNK